MTNRLVDAGQAGINQWVTSGGFQVTRRPTVSDLRGTYLTSRSGERLIINHSWPGQDYGVSVQGYENNLGLGKLTLDVGPGSTFNFRSASNRPAALYVDYLELKNRGTNYNEPLVFNIDPNLTIYFANANVAAEKLDGGARGRIRWVRDYTGPLSSTNIIYPSGSNYTFNLALVSSPDIDSDGDGIPNSSDPTPIFVEESVALTVAMLHNEEKGYRKAVLTWNSLAYATNFLEYKPALASPQWLTLTNFVSGGITQPVSILDDVPASGSRLYRVRVQPNRSKR